jgi:glycosyltransferase involved in cell wall biosynthesis
MAWLDAEPSVDLHAVLWAAGPAGTKPYDHGRFYDVGADHRRLAARAARQVGLARVGGGLAGRAVRSTLRGIPTDGVLYLSTARSGAVMRYLPPGERTVVTHLHATDRRGEVLPDDKVAQLRDATDVWLAADDETRTWAAEVWGIDVDSITVVPEPVDPSTWNRATRLGDRNQLRMGLSGAAWFRSDHAGRLVQTLLRLRPELDLELVWTEVIRSKDHLAPLLHDLDHLGVGDAMELPRSADEVMALLDDIDVLAVTTPDDEAPWVAWEAATLGVPIVCFDTHRVVPNVEEGVGLVVPYLDVVAMAEAVLAIHDEDREAGSGINTRRAELRRRDVTVIGPRLLDLAQRVEAS